MKKIIIAILLLILSSGILFAPNACAWEDRGYWENMKYDFVRFFKNTLGSPLEIPVTIKEYDEGEGRAVLRHTAGFFDGCIRMVSRLISGAYDLGAAFIPGMQEGVPVEPETLF